MENKAKDRQDKNPVLQSMLSHLAEENVNPKETDLWPAIRVHLAASKSPLKRKEFSMKKRMLVPAFAAVVVLALVAVFMAKNVTPVSAKTVLDKASVVLASSRPTEGIEHMRSEFYSNYQALAEDQGMDTILESYHDLQSGKTRVVTIDSKTGKVLDASSYDGSNTYSRDYGQENPNKEAPLVIYRTPQGQVAGLKPIRNIPDEGSNARDLFDMLQKDPAVKLVGQETWADGRTVYVLQSHQPVKVMVKEGSELPTGLVSIYFDSQTFEQLSYRMSIEKDGKQLLVGSQKILLNEVLPAGSSVAWDLSDLQGVTIVDDPNREHGDLLPEVISAQQLAARTKSGYLLKTLPEGYTLEISEPQIKAGSSEPYMYIASYRNEANDYFVIQAGMGGPSDSGEEKYTTASGLVLHIMMDSAEPSGKQYSTTVVEAPDGTSFMIDSTLPIETVKAWAEELEPVR
jgi:hypothetical protein